jgi:ABC-type histidine transport system ATPase subunit
MENGLNQVRPIIQVNDLHKSFGAHEVLRGISLAVEPGAVVSLIGASGSGKSTFLRCLNYLERPSSGEIIVDGETIGAIAGTQGRRAAEPSSRDIARMRSTLGMVFQQFNLWPHMTVLGNVIEAPMQVKRLPRREAEDLGRQFLAKVNLLDKQNEYPAKLSGGQQQRVAIARALLSQPAVVFADEPTGNLDSNASADLLSFLRRSVTDLGQSIVMVTHDPRGAAYADRVVFLADGQVVGELQQPTADSILEQMRTLGA